MIKKQKKIKQLEVCGVIVVDWATTSVLVVQGRKTGKLSFPKGHKLHSNEHEYECAKRELFEETGILLTCNMNELPKTTILGHIYFIYWCQNYESTTVQFFEVHDKTEISNVMWMNIFHLNPNWCNRALQKAILSLRQMLTVNHSPLNQLLY